MLIIAQKLKVKFMDYYVFDIWAHLTHDTM